MAATRFGIVYSTDTLNILRLIIPDDDSALTDGTHALEPGEAQITESLEILPMPVTPDVIPLLAAIVQATRL